MAGLGEADELPWVVAGIALVVSLVALGLDAFGGIVVGLAGAAALVAYKRATGAWEPGAFGASAVETVALAAAGAAFGWAGAGLRRREDEGGVPRGAVAPVFGSLGLVGADVAMLRLEEEVERARSYGRSLSVMVLDLELTGPDLDPEEREAALRAVARILETRLLDRDVPFAISPTRLGAILPESGVVEGWDRAGGVLDAARRATFMSRADGERRPVPDVVRIHAALAGLGSATDTADALLDAAVEGVRQRSGAPA